MGSSINIGGLATGVQWRDLVDQLLAAERARNITPLQTQVSAADKRKVAWNELSGLVQKLQDAGNTLKQGTAFKSFAAAASLSAQSNRALLNTSATIAARPGAYKVEVVELARAEKLSGAVVADSATALAISGSFTVAGQAVTIAATDTLDGVRDKINALNVGSNATKVSASVLSSAGGQKRLVLSADNAGGAGVGLLDGTEGALRDLGFLDTRSRAVPSSTLGIAAALGVTSPPPSSVRVGNRTVSVDLNVDSISTIVAKIRAAGGQAEVQRETVGGVPSYRMSVGSNVTATADPNSAATLATLGFAAGAQSSVQHVVSSGLAFQNGTNAAASSGTLLTDLRANGASLGVNVGDTLTFTGQRGDGTLVNTSFVVGGADTMATLTAALNDSATGFGSTTRGATASIDPDGKLRMTDSTGGDSRLRLSMSLSPAAGGAPASLLGVFDTETVGRARAMVQGTDAQIRVDGVLLSRSTNSIADAIEGVTLNLLQAEAGTEIDVTVTRDQEASVKAVKDFATAFNNVVSFSAGQQLSGQPLATNGSLRRIISSLTQSLRTIVPEAGDYSRATLAGFTLTQAGTVEVGETALRTAMTANLSGIQALFGATGIGNAIVAAANEATQTAIGTIPTLVSNISAQNIRANKRITQLQERVEQRQQALIARFTAMETAVSRLQNQGNSLSAAVFGSSPGRN
jgi:flagellar hook-associated protein 2